MKTLLLSLLIALQFPAIAQRGLDLIDIQKFHIKKISIIHLDGKKRWVHFYDENGRILKTESGSGELLNEYTYQTNSSENRTYTWQGTTQTLTRTEKSLYDSKSRLTKLDVTDEFKRAETWSYEYDANGNRVKATKRSGGAIASITMYDYANGKLMEERISNQQGLIEKTSYKYDANGLLIEKKHTENNRPPRVESWKYLYDSAGKLVEEQTFLGRIDTGIFKYRYNSNGLLENWIIDEPGPESKTSFIAEFY
jgi:YD repeat-containing protein